MKTNQWAIVISCAMLVMLSVGLAEAANGTLTVTFKYKDPTTQVDQNLNDGYVYLRDAAKPPPMEKFLSKADYILGGRASTINGKITVPVPAGKYFIRVLQRKVFGQQPPRPYGPPEPGDLTWFQTSPITITAGATLDLGTKYANPFGSTITITGTVKDLSGAPLAGRYIRVQTVPCVPNNWCGSGYCEQVTNLCGQPKISTPPTEADGRYMLNLRDPGTYYIYAFSSWDKEPGCSGYCAPPIESTAVGYPGYVGGWYQLMPITVQMGDTKTADIVTY